MSLSVEINLPEGKKYKPAELIPEGLEYGTYDDNYVLKAINGDEDSVIIFDPEKIGGGICLEVGEATVNLDMPLVAGPDEIRLYYDIIKHICNKFNTIVFSRDGEMASLGKTESYIEADIKRSDASLFMMLKKLESGDDKIVTLFCALNPIVLSLNDLKKIGADSEKLGTMLHEKQSAKAYYVGQKFFVDPGDQSLIGVYLFSADTYSIMPYAPQKPFYLEQKVNKWVVYLYVSDEMYGYIPFEVFSKHIKDLGRYDETHYFCEMNKYQARAMIKDNAIEM